MTNAVTPAEFAALMAPLGPFEARPRVAVAVSGGADSLCLALLAQHWARELGGEAVALTVDHGLRPDSGAEAAQVGRWLAGHGMRHHVLVWQGDKPAADVQAEARAARYRLLEQWCRAEGVLHLLLAHHRDDQAETLLLRLARGSGVDGLAAMAPITEGFAARFLRPLLGTPRARLATTLAALGQGWVEDPSNRNIAFARVRMRHLQPTLAAEGMTAERLAHTARRLGRARAALEDWAAQAAARWVTPHPAGHALVDPAVFRLVPEEVGLRLLSRLVQAVGGASYPPREERVVALHRRLAAGLARAVTVAGCRVGPCDKQVLVSREAGRMAPAMALTPGATHAWDGRFRLEVAADAPLGLSVGALGATGWNQVAALVKPRRLPSLPAPVRPTLPAVYDQQGLCAVPHLGYNRGSAAGSVLRWIIAAPAVPLTAAGHRLV